MLNLWILRSRVTISPSDLTSGSTMKGAVCERMVEAEFARHGYSTFIPPWGQQPVQDLVAIRGHDVRLVQVKKARAKKSKQKGEVGPCAVRPGAIVVSFKGGSIASESRYQRNKRNFFLHVSEYNTLAVVWGEDVGLFTDQSLWENGSLYLSIDPAVCKSPLFYNYVKPKWLTGEDQTPVATESKLSVAV